MAIIRNTTQSCHVAIFHVPLGAMDISGKIATWQPKQPLAVNYQYVVFPIIMRYVKQVSRWRKFVKNANRVWVSMFAKNKKINSCGASPVNGENVLSDSDLDWLRDAMFKIHGVARPLG